MDNILEKLRAPAGTRFSDALEIVRAGEKDLADYDVHISQIESFLRLVKHRKERLNHYIINCRSLLSPIRRLPEELLSEIFLWCCLSSPICIYYDPDALPLTLSAVCSSWRELVIASPSLWSNYYISTGYLWLNSDPETVARDQILASTFQLCLSRSKNTALSLQTDCLDDGLEIMMSLMRQSHRWYEVVFSAAENTWETLSQLSGLHNLRSLDILDPNDKILNALSPYLRDAPRLRSLRIFRDALSGQVVDFFPFSQLLNLELRDSKSDYHDLIRVLQNCVSLKCLTYAYDSLCHDTPEEFMHLPSVTLNHLGTLEIRLLTNWDLEYSSYPINSFLPQLTVPSLTKLKLTMSTSPICPFGRDSAQPEPEPERPFPFSLDTLARLVKRSNCTMTTLYLERAVVKDTDIIKLLWHSPSLTRLTIHDPPLCASFISITANLIAAMNPLSSVFRGVSQALLIPRLKILTFRCVGWKGFEMGKLVDMLASRWIPNEAYSKEIGVDCLRFFKLTSDDPEDKITGDSEAGRILLQLQNAGLCVEAPIKA
ncbi:hypothetical protein VKT23_006392 [Stygiomarasmius scandens]|uniref:F-box domain-containing protein n=1 Tax=Marasmiellus scandens TaxID=2682957 RepID=A0ABR1JMP1_9AGAR